MKGKDAERMQYPESRVLGHTVKSCMTVIGTMGRYPKGIRKFKPAHIVPALFELSI